MPDVGTRRLVLEVGGTDYTDSVSTAAFRSAETDSDFVSFADAAAGGKRDYALGLVLKQNTTALSLWDVIWSETGDDVECVVWPLGKPVDGTPTATQPSFTATCTVIEPEGDLLGGEANASNSARMTVEVEWPCLAKPVKEIA